VPFEVVGLSGCQALTSDLRRVSDDWIAHHAVAKRVFRWAGSSPAYVAEFPAAVVRVAGRVVAFATLWTTAKRTGPSIDSECAIPTRAQKNIMDFPVVELMGWGTR